MQQLITNIIKIKIETDYFLEYKYTTLYVIICKMNNKNIFILNILYRRTDFAIQAESVFLLQKADDSQKIVRNTFFEKQNIRLIAVTDGTDTASKSYNKLITTVKAAVAEEYSETLSKNTRAAQLESAKQCRHLGGLPPLGYRVNEVGLYEIDENTAPIIRDIFQLYLRGMDYDYIQKSLKQKGYQTANGNDFSKSAINSILKNQKYMGT